MNKWRELTDELRRAGFVGLDEGQTVVSGTKKHNRINNPKVEALLRQRRAILEQASGKLVALRAALMSIGPTKVARCLIYTSAKPSIIEHQRQIRQVNALLADLGIVSHQFTNAETSKADAQKYLEGFGRDDYQVLTAMKVLDEGIDIPQTNLAFILASSTVRREWVQRRGRILRAAEGKSKASLHDFLVVPPDADSKDGRSVLRGELQRAEEFATLADNEWSSGGPRSVLARWDDAAWTKG
jgi:superfamily II DNA or RNA helicase